MNETQLGKGAVVTPTIKKMPTIGMATTPFDWNTGFSVSELITKNQNGSGSCGGQAVSYKGEAESGVPKSAKFPYSQIFVRGGGSSEVDLIKIIVTEGLCDEGMFPSYQNGQPPSEAFMEDSSGITPAMLLNARPLQGTPSYVNLDFDSIAQAIRDNKGIIIGIYGKDNGTWLSADPTPPLKIDNTVWAHWLFVGKAFMRNGKKVIGVKNSWGNVGENGWQYLTEGYLPYIWSAWTFNKSKYVFNKNLSLGMNNEDVFALQAYLGIKPTGFFGAITLYNVIKFQTANNIPSTGFVGTLTRAKLNK